MDHRLLGGSGLKVPVLTLGTGTFGGKGEFFKGFGESDVTEATRLVDMALDAGVTCFDTADIYSAGASEEILGRALAGRRDRALISTKATFRAGDGPNDVGSSRHHLTRAVEGSLRRLGTDYIDLFQLHGFDALTPIEEVLRTLDDLVRAGKVRYIGCSNFSGWHLMKSLSISDRYGFLRYVDALGGDHGGRAARRRRVPLSGGGRARRGGRRDGEDGAPDRDQLAAAAPDGGERHRRRAQRRAAPAEPGRGRVVADAGAGGGARRRERDDAALPLLAPARLPRAQPAAGVIVVYDQGGHPMTMTAPSSDDFEKLGVFYLGRRYDLERHVADGPLVLYPSKNLTTHAVCIGMTGSGKTGLCLGLLEEAAIDAVPVLAIDPKGDLGNLLLTFPSLDGAALAPWVEEGVDPEAEAAKWRRGLAEWGQEPARIARLREAADFAIYTPGSRAGLPLAILKSLAAPPPSVRDEPDLLRERVEATVAGVLAMCGLGASVDGASSREQVFVATLVERAWRAGADLDLPGLIREVQRPPIDRVGALDLETFFPSKDRAALAMALNTLVASPSFAAFAEGAPLDAGKMLYSENGRPRVAVVSIAHLGDAERMAVVTLLLQEVLAWTRAQRGTSSLRAIVYMDEVAGYVPPVAMPPSKRPLLTLFKQARAFGVGVVLATQNPVDLDYKALSNAGTWFIGRLQTERDKARVLDGLEGAAASAGRGFDRATMERTLAGLGSRVFLLNDVRADAPIVFQTRWTLSYLRGPITRDEIRRLMEPARAPVEAQAARPAASPSTGTGGERPALPSEIREVFLPLAGAGADAAITYVPRAVAQVAVRFLAPKLGVDERREGLVVAPLVDGPFTVDWDHADELRLRIDQLAKAPAPGARFAPLPSEAWRAKSWARWAKELAAWMQAHQVITLYRSPSTGEVSRPGESEGEFRARLQHESREDRDREVERLRAKWASKLNALDEKLRRARQAREREAEQARAATLDTALSVGATVLGSLLGGRGRSSTRAIVSGARGATRAMKQSKDVARAEETISALAAQRAELERRIEEEVAALGAERDPLTELLEPVEVRPRRADVAVPYIALAWAPVVEKR
jgi:hypothetical protein